MILRRVAANFRRQDWTAVAIELVVVVVGVFIGVQASNWNAQRETDQKSAVFTARLKADLRNQAWMYELETGYLQQVLVNAKRAADALTGRAPLSDEALLVAAYRATQKYSYTEFRTTYDQLTATGQMGLIRDVALRDLAMRVFTQPWFDTLQHASPSAYRNRFRSVLPYEVQDVLAKQCGDRTVPVGDYDGIAHMLEHPCAAGLPPATVAASVARLRNDPQILALLQRCIADTESDLVNFTTTLAHDYRDPLRRLAREQP